MNEKIKSVLELCRYKIGESAWWVVLRPTKIKDQMLEEAWMKDHHAKVLLERGPLKKLWTNGVRIPRLHHVDFSNITSLMTNKLVVEEFNISEIYRSPNTGEFFCSNQDEEWMPENFLFDSIVAARRERTRVLKLIRKWAEQ
jgi:hypothetical protein